MAAPILPPSAGGPRRHPVLRWSAAGSARLLRTLLTRAAAGRDVDCRGAGHHLAAVLDLGTVCRGGARPGLPTPGPCRRQSGSSSSDRWPRNAGRVRATDHRRRDHPLRRRAARHEPQPFPAGGVVGLTASHHRCGRVHGRQLGCTCRRSGGCAASGSGLARACA